MVKNGDNVLKVNVVVKKNTVEQTFISVPLEKDVRKITVNVMKLNVEKDLVIVLKVNVVMLWVIVGLPLDIVHLDKDVKKNMENVPKEDVVKYGDNVLKDNVVVKRDIVE